jgi:hypothetical protein
MPVAERGADRDRAAAPRHEADNVYFNIKSSGIPFGLSTGDRAAT